MVRNINTSPLARAIAPRLKTQSSQASVPSLRTIPKHISRVPSISWAHSPASIQSALVFHCFLIFKPIFIQMCPGHFFSLTCLSMSLTKRYRWAGALSIISVPAKACVLTIDCFSHDPPFSQPCLRQMSTYYSLNVPQIGLKMFRADILPLSCAWRLVTITFVNRINDEYEQVELFGRIFCFRKNGPSYLFPLDFVCLLISIAIQSLRTQRLC